jgi:hypothetical protein
MHIPTATPQLVCKAGLLGVGLDGADGHSRITRGDDFVLVGGSEDTHKELQETVARFQQELDRRGKTLLDLTDAELAEIAEQL